jgi:hypothetical protein
LYHDENVTVTVGFLATEYLPEAEEKLKPNEFWNVRTACMDFLIPLYANYLVDNFTPKCLKMTRTAMVQSGRFSRKVINGYVKRIVAMFKWGTGEDMVSGSTLHALKAITALCAGEQNTFDHAERVEVPDDVVALTLPFLPPVVSQG